MMKMATSKNVHFWKMTTSICDLYVTYVYIYISLYTYMVVDQNSFIPERPFFANKNFTFAKLSRTPCLSFAGPMLANNTSYEDRSPPAKLRQRITDHFLVAF